MIRQLIDQIDTLDIRLSDDSLRTEDYKRLGIWRNSKQSQLNKLRQI